MSEGFCASCHNRKEVKFIQSLEYNLCKNCAEEILIDLKDWLE